MICTTGERLLYRLNIDLIVDFHPIQDISDVTSEAAWVYVLNHIQQKLPNVEIIKEKYGEIGKVAMLLREDKWHTQQHILGGKEIERED